MLLEGPPGTGKTELVIELSEELFGGAPVTISGPEILSKWVGESERILREKFEEARESDGGVLYIDELDAIARERSQSSHEHSAQLVAQLLVLLDGVDAKQERDEPKVIASTNLAEIVDPVLKRPGRLGNQPITFPRPGDRQRRATFHHYLEAMRTSDRGDDLGERLRTAARDPHEPPVFGNLAASSKGWTGADIEDTLVEAATHHRRSDDEMLTLSTVLEAVDDRTIDREYNVRTQDTRVEGETGTNRYRIEGEGCVACLLTLSEQRVESFAAAWNDTVADDPLTLRRVEARNLIGPTRRATADRVTTACAYDPNARLCLVIEGLPMVIDAAGRSPLAELVLEELHDEILAWPASNVLLHAAASDALSLPTVEVTDRKE